MLPEVQDYIFRINEHCKTQNIWEYTKRSEIIYQLQSLRSIYELNGKEVDEYVKIYNATLFWWKVKILDILDRNFFQKNEISKIVVDGFILTIIIESIVATIRFFRKRKLSKG